MTRQQQAYGYGLGAVLLWSTVASAFKLSLRYLQPVELLFWAAVTSCLVLLGLLQLQGKGGLLRRAGWAEWRPSLLLGLLNPALYYLILFQAYAILPAQQAQPLNYTWAITLTLLSVPLLGHRLKRLELLAVLVSYLGVVVISTRGDLLGLEFEHPTGVGLALLSTLFWSVYWICNARDRRDSVLALLLNFICGLPPILIWLLLTAGFRLPPLQGMLGACYVGIFEMGVTFVLWARALQLTDSTARIANLIFLSPFLSLVFIAVLVGETIHPATVVGLALIVAGLVLQQLRRPQV